MQTTVPIKGMHCRSCELLIEDELKAVKTISGVKLNYRRGEAVVEHQGKLDWNQVATAVNRAGYEIGAKEAKPLLSKNLDDYLDLFYAVVVLGVLYLVVDILDLKSIIDSSANNPTSIFAVLAVGLTAGFSTCMALIGGLVLSISAKFAEAHPGSSAKSRFRPHLMFNAGRIVSYAVFGGVIGLVGSLFQFSGFSLGLMTLAVALVMLTLGLQLTNLFPRLEDIKFSLPSGLAKRFKLLNKKGEGYSDKSAALMGAATFFLPCGFTQAMQLYAMSTGSFIEGALIMALFAIGTAPGLLSIGGLTSALKGEIASKFYKFAGVVVVLMALYNTRNALNLIGWQPAFASSITPTSSSAPAVAAGEVQVLKASYTQNGGLAPGSWTAKVGQPVRFEIDSKESGIGCMGSVMISGFTRPKYFEAGERISFEFTPKKPGNITVACAMGVPHGYITVN